ncbi:hemerythrin domain-containing protein [Methylobacterium crusticola]|nr:hemerythrin domain-containing protein [Methylobacterium crusticola]
MIARDHENIGQLIREIPNALNGPGTVRSRERLMTDLIDQLGLHAEALEASLYAVLARHARTGPLIETLRRDHGQVMKKLAPLARYGRRPQDGWLNAFEDVTYLADQQLHALNHEFLPAARALLSAGQVADATQTFVRAKTRALRSPRYRTRVGAGGNELFLTASVVVAAAGLGLLAWRSGLLRGMQDRRPRPLERDDRDPERGRADLAAASAPGNRVPGEDLKERQDKLLDQALEETFPSSDPISPKQITK